MSEWIEVAWARIDQGRTIPLEWWTGEPETVMPQIPPPPTRKSLEVAAWPPGTTVYRLDLSLAFPGHCTHPECAYRYVLVFVESPFDISSTPCWEGDERPNRLLRLLLLSRGHHRELRGTYVELGGPIHSQVPVEHPRHGVVEIDDELAPLVEALWRNGIDTFASCQGDGSQMASIAFPNVHDLLRFLRLVAHGLLLQDDLSACEHMMGTAGRFLVKKVESRDTPFLELCNNNWSYGLHLDWPGDQLENGPSVSASLKFPREDIEYVVAALPRDALE